MKKNCNSCRAIGGIYPNMYCRLGFKIGRVISLGIVSSFVPLEECPKPLTFDAYFTIVQDRETAEIDKQRSK